MTPKEKAKELVDKFTIPFYEWDGNGYNINWDETFKNRKQCALIAVDEILNSNEDWDLEQNIWCDTGFFGDCQMYWIKVKQEIEKL